MHADSMVDGRLVRVPEVAIYLGLSRSTVYALMEHGQLGYVKIGKSRRIRRAELLRFVDSHTVQSQVPDLDGSGTALGTIKTKATAG